MSVNLVDLVMKQVGGSLPGIVGSLLGESADRTQGALAGAVPAILGGLMGAASKGGDVADKLTAAIGEQDTSMLDNLAGAFGGGNHKQIVEQGSSMLTSLLGDGVVGTLVGAIGKFSGLGGGSTKSLLGMLVPIVMSVLGREQKAQGLDGGGMMNLLMSQKDNITAAMPSGMASALGGAGFLDDIMGSAQSATASIGEALETTAGTVGKAAGQAATAAGAAADDVKDAASRAVGSASAAAGQGEETAGGTSRNVAGGTSKTASDPGAAVTGAAEGGGSMMRWLLPLIILAALLWFAFQYLGGDADVEQAAGDAGDAVQSAVEETMEAAGDAADTASDAVDAAGDAVGDAADAASDAAGDAADTASDAADAAGDAAGDAADAATDAAGDAADAASDAADSAGDAVSSAADSVTAMVGDIDVAGGLTSMFDDVTSTLSGITDQASAEAALPELEGISSSLDELTGLAEQLPESAASGISEMVSSGLEGLDGAMQTLKDIPGVGDYIEPIIAEIREKLAAFTAG